VVDKPKLDQLLSNLRQYVGVLRGLADSASRETFLSSPDKVGNAKYHFVIAIECCIDIANHIIASENYRFPKDNADSFTALEENGVFDSRVADELRAMARFRNRLVHLYWDVDDRRIHEYLQRSLSDLEQFARTIAGRAW